MAFAYKGTFTVTSDSAKLPSSQTDFRLLVLVTDNSLKSVANGGQVQNTTTFNGQTVPADVVFKLASDLSGAAMSFSIISWSATTGAMEARVKKATLALGDLFYCGIGDASITTYQGGAVGADCDASYLCAYPLGDGVTLNLNDYSANGYNLTNVGSWGAAAGQVGGGTAKADGTSQYLHNDSFPSSPASIRVSWWQKMLTGDPGQDVAFYFTTGGTANPRLLCHAPYSDGNVYWDYSDATAGQGRISASYSAYLDIWAKVTCTYDNVSGLHKLRVNNSTLTSNTHSSANPNVSQLELNANTPFFGKRQMDEFTIANSARSDNWDTAEYNNELSPSTFVTSAFASVTPDAQDWLPSSVQEKSRRLFQVGY